MSTPSKNVRDLDQGLTLDLKEKLTYDRYLDLERLLKAQHPRSRPEHHDEMLFIIQHQTSELWFKLIIHELQAACAYLAADRLHPCLKILARVKHIQRQLFEQWAVLETLTPTEYLEFRDVLGPSSGFQSLQYRMVEFLFGNKNAAMIKLFDYDPEGQQRLRETLFAPSLYDQFLAFLARRGHPMPEDRLSRDFSQPSARDERLLPVFQHIYEQPRSHWDLYDFCEKLVDVEESFQLWRFRHLRTVERIIGNKRGTGGSAGVSFLKKALDLSFFPELIDVRTVLRGPHVAD